MADYVLVPLHGKRGTGHFAKVDGCDVDLVAPYRWYRDKDGYALAIHSDGASTGMHRLINGTPPGMLTDHINHDKLDNRRCNLRSVTNAQNQANRAPGRKASPYVGVTHDAHGYIARIMHRGKRIHLGRFTTAEEAALAYNVASFRLYADKAVLNEL